MSLLYTASNIGAKSIYLYICSSEQRVFIYILIIIFIPHLSFCLKVEAFLQYKEISSSLKWFFCCRKSFLHCRMTPQAGERLTEGWLDPLHWLEAANCSDHTKQLLCQHRDCLQKWDRLQTELPVLSWEILQVYTEGSLEKGENSVGCDAILYVHSSPEQSFSPEELTSVVWR